MNKFIFELLFVLVTTILSILITTIAVLMVMFITFEPITDWKGVRGVFVIISFILYIIFNIERDRGLVKMLRKCFK